MDVNLFKNTSVPNELNKNLIPVASYVGAVVVNPTGTSDVEIQMTVPTGTLKWNNVNYFSWDGAYYFITDVQHEGQNISILHGEMDVLMTYKAAINALSFLPARSTTNGSDRISDELRRITVDATRSVVPFPNNIDDTEEGGTYILTASQTGYTEMFD